MNPMAKPVQIKSFLSQREIEICGRLRELRLQMSRGQPEFARQIGISRVRLASYEYAKAPLRYWLARDICQRFDVSQRWLAMGAGPEFGHIDIAPNIEQQIDQKELFSEAYDRVLCAAINEHWNQVAVQAGVSPEKFRIIPAQPAGSSIPAGRLFLQLFFHLRQIIKLHVDSLPTSALQVAYFTALADAGDEFIERKKEEIERLKNASPADDRTPSKKGGVAPVAAPVATADLTNVPIAEHSSVMRRLSLALLIARAQRITKRERGKASALASFLNVSRSRVSEWLSGEAQPDGEHALKLLSWVEAEEAKQKRPGTASTAPGQKTQRKVPTTNEEPPSSRRKK